MDFAYRNLVEFLREQLWQRKPGQVAGRASVMVGAGFSRNASPSITSAREFPTWPELTKTLCNALYPGMPFDKISAGAGNALGLAQEFEAVFGRFRLEELIRLSIPDTERQPGDLHRRLLALPWADVFTTNWDTLLERARLDVHERLYDAVLTQSQIPSASVPRIVKLHGTLPAHTPFILTEEDYRTYPTRFAPFVNLVQQAMMENAFVLVGFSGDDPNFLHWSGWVRDNLGVHAPKIYLVNWLALSRQRRRMLEERNVMPLDLAELPQASSWPSDRRHAYSIDWFLHAMEGGRLPQASAWPQVRAARRIPDHLGWVLADVTVGTVEEPFPRANFRSPIQERVADFRLAVAAWTTNRRSYPNWLIAPVEVRNRLWQDTLSWLGGLKSLLEVLPLPERLCAIGELLWRLEVCLTDPEVVEGMGDALKQIVHAINLDTRSLQLDDGSLEELSTDQIDAARRSLRSMARGARSAGRKDDFDRVLASLLKISRGNAEWEEDVRYERLLWHAHRLDHQPLEEALDQWDIELLDPVWGFRKAAFLSGVSRMHEARFVLRTALARVRRERRRDTDDFASLSREAWGLWLARACRRIFSSDDEITVLFDDPFDRWRELSQYGSDAMGDYRSLLSDMLEPVPVGETTKNRGFDLGNISTSVHLRHGLPRAYRAALQLVSIAELTALPPSANHVSLIKDGLAQAVELLANDQPLRSGLIAFSAASAGSDAVLASFFSRARVAVLTVDDVAQLSDVAKGSLDYSYKRARPPDPRHEYWLTRLRVAVEVMSRLVIRVSVTEVICTLDRAELLYRLGWPIADRWMSTELENLFSRTIESLPQELLPKRLLGLLDLPIPGTPDFLPLENVSHWRDPCAINQRLRTEQKKRNLTLDREGSTGLVSRILAAAKNGHTARRIGVTRLLVLKAFDALDSDEIQALADLIWLDSDALPTGLDIQPWAFVVLPEPQVGVGTQTFRETFIQTRKADMPLSRIIHTIGYALWQSRIAGIPFVLTNADAVKILDLINEWVNASYRSDTAFTLTAVRAEVDVIDGLGRILTEHAYTAAELMGVWLKAEKLDETPKAAARPFALYPGLLRAFPERLNELSQRMRQSLVSTDPDIACAAIQGLYLWLEAASNFVDIAPPSDDLVAAIGVIVASRRRGVIGWAVELARWIFDEGPSSMRPLIASDCDLGLSYLMTEASYESELKGGPNEGSDVALLRRHCVLLAIAMKASGARSGGGVQRWLDAAASDPLPEVRYLLAQPKVADPQ